ncbi:GGDEF domain-containing protein [Bosea caraganae]|uniref:GGDEF domain-containing protein n=1 Tax=Bosea caraganae TaxID=2763117 RepID=A0A370L9B0_9HYPH|nr:GGDEF domain-containing protein [Bosea caraganae]RDJ26836.1 GGDEF domain-containing protein [Bosea caraganae]RDJ30722.1 GGDEF domain-containing protein [Bosea caraganae]
MGVEAPSYSLPRWRWTRWLTDAGHDVPADIRIALIGSLFGTLPIFAGGVINTMAVSLLIALRIPTAPFIFWCGFEIACCLARLAVLVSARKQAERGQPTPTDLFVLLGLAWAAGIGYGTFISLTSGDWVIAALACLSAAAMVGGTCFRNFAAPRMAGLMIFLVLGACCLAAPFLGEPIMLIVFFQIPAYLLSMTAAAYKLNAMLVSTMRAEREHEFHARHDMLTGLSNRSGLSKALDLRFARDAGSRRLALIYLDLDGFKAVNDTHGHMAGDRLLQLVAERLRGMVRAGDLAARIGGDEFIVLSGQTETAQLLGFGERLIREISLPYELDNRNAVTVGASIGIALAPEHGTDMASLLSAADMALYQAKSKGKSRCVIAPPGLHANPFAAATLPSGVPQLH